MKLTNQNIAHQSLIDEDEDFNFKEVIVKYLKHWKWFFSSISIAVFIAFFVNQITPELYKVESKFLIKEESNALNLFDSDAGGNNNIMPKGQKMANETIILKSRTIVDEVLDELPFDVEYYNLPRYTRGKLMKSEFYNNSPIMAYVDWTHTQVSTCQMEISWVNDSLYQFEFLEINYRKVNTSDSQKLTDELQDLANQRFKFGEWVALPDIKFTIHAPVEQDSGNIILKFRDKESLISQYSGDNLQISPVDKISSILIFRLETEQPQKGRDFLNALMSVFLENELERKNAKDLNTIKFIDSQLTGITDSLSLTENRLEEFRSRSRTIDITNEGNKIFENLSELENLLSEEKYKKEYYEHLQNYLAQEDYSEIVVPSGLGIDDPVLNRMIEDLTTLQADKSRFLSVQTENSPAVLEVNRKINYLKISINQVIESATLNSLLLIRDLQSRISKIEKQLGELPQTEQDLLNIKRTYTINETLYTFLLQQRAQSSISLASNAPSNEIIELAVTDMKPMQLKSLLNYFLAILLGLIIPITIIFSLDFFAVKITNIKEVEQNINIPILGYTNENKNPGSLVVLNHPRTSIAESFRAVRTNINLIPTNGKQLTIMITSSIAGEGKTFYSMNLASAYSLSGKRTLIIGCDLHKSFNFGELDVSNDQGLSSYLSGQIKDTGSAIQSTAYPNLEVLVPGPIPPNPAEMIVGERFEMMLKELKDIYDVIILDSSPIGLTNETLHLTSLVDFSIFVLRQNYSQKSSIDFINELTEKDGIENLYVILNGINKKYMNYGGYGFGYFAEDQKKMRSLKSLFKFRNRN